MTVLASPAHTPDPRGFNRWLVRGLGCVFGVYVGFMSLAALFEQDESEAIHSAWKILHGELIYIDFFQHHHPLLYVYLAPIIVLCGEHAATAVVCRIAMLPFFLGILAATWQLALRLFDKRTALVAAGCLLLSWTFLFFGTQIRPDVPEVLFGMLALVLLYPRTRGQAAKRPKPEVIRRDEGPSRRSVMSTESLTLRPAC